MIESKFAKKQCKRLMIRDSSSSAEAVWFNQTYLKSQNLELVKDIECMEK